MMYKLRIYFTQEQISGVEPCTLSSSRPGNDAGDITSQQFCQYFTSILLSQMLVFRG